MTSLVREAMVAEPATLPRRRLPWKPATGSPSRTSGPSSSRTATAGWSGWSRGRRSCREVVAAGRDPRATPLGEIAEAPRFTVDADLPVDEAFHLLEEEDLERVPVVEDGRLVGVLSRSVLQRRLAEDEPPELPPAA